MHGEFKTSQIAADSSNTAKAHVWIGYIVCACDQTTAWLAAPACSPRPSHRAVVLALANAVVGQYKFIVKARDQRTVAKYHGHVGSMVYFFSLIAACLGIANTMLDKSKEASQHALGITAIVSAMGRRLLPSCCQGTPSHAPSATGTHLPAAGAGDAGAHVPAAGHLPQGHVR